MGIEGILAIGGLVLKFIELAQDAFGDDNGAGKKTLVTTAADVLLRQKFPGITEDQMTEATAEVDAFIESGVKLMKALGKTS